MKSAVNVEAEKAVLGAVLINNDIFQDVEEFLTGTEFFVNAHQELFKVFKGLISKNQVVDPISLSNYMNENNAFKDLGGEDYLKELVSVSLNLGNAVGYSKIVYDKFLRRKLIEMSQEAISECMSEGTLSGSEIEKSPWEKLEEKIINLTSGDATDNSFIEFSTAAGNAYQDLVRLKELGGALPGVSTGFKDLDDLIGGLNKSDLIIIAARPGMGKTSLALNIAYNVAKKSKAKTDKSIEDKKNVAFFSLEMSPEQLAMRILASEAEIEVSNLRKGRVNNTQMHQLSAAIKELENTSIAIDDTAGINISQIRNRARRLKRKHKSLSLIVVDYIQLISSNNNHNNRVLEISEITRGLKNIAKELDVPVIAISQLSRAVESRDDKKPRLSDLRESGSIEQDADLVAFIYREEYYLEQSRPKETEEGFAKWQEKMQAEKGIANIIFAKNRHGPTKIVNMSFNGPYNRFGDFYKND